jgi:hypothetical protein
MNCEAVQLGQAQIVTGAIKSLGEGESSRQRNHSRPLSRPALSSVMQEHRHVTKFVLPSAEAPGGFFKHAMGRSSLPVVGCVLIEIAWLAM